MDFASFQPPNHRVFRQTIIQGTYSWIWLGCQQLIRGNGNKRLSNRVRKPFKAENILAEKADDIFNRLELVEKKIFQPLIWLKYDARCLKTSRFIVVLDNGLAPVRRQAINESNGDESNGAACFRHQASMSNNYQRFDCFPK